MASRLTPPNAFAFSSRLVSKAEPTFSDALAVVRKHLRSIPIFHVFSNATAPNSRPNSWSAFPVPSATLPMGQLELSLGHMRSSLAWRAAITHIDRIAELFGSLVCSSSRAAHSLSLQLTLHRTTEPAYCLRVMPVAMSGPSSLSKIFSARPRCLSASLKRREVKSRFATLARNAPARACHADARRRHRRENASADTARLPRPARPQKDDTRLLAALIHHAIDSGSPDRASLSPAGASLGIPRLVLSAVECSEQRQNLDSFRYVLGGSSNSAAERALRERRAPSFA